MKKLLLLTLSVLTILTLVGCKEEEPPVDFEAILTIHDIDLSVNDVHSIVYELSPAGTLADVTLDITSSSIPNVVSINNLTITAIQAGTATITARATNRAGQEQEFDVSTTFTVTVTGSSSTSPGQVLNGGFEDGLTSWTITSPYGADVFSTEVVDNNPHGGVAALSLWYDDNDDSVGEVVDVTLSQDLSNIEAETYLFSLWYQGTVDSIQMTIKTGETVLTNDTFDGLEYDPVPDHLGYVHLGVEVTLNETTDLTLLIEIDGAEDSWGYLDDVGFNVGSLADLLLAPQSNEAGYINFIPNGDFAQVTSWTIDVGGTATNKTATITGGNLQIWADGPAVFEISQTISIDPANYHLVLYINGGVTGEEFNASEAYAYVDDGSTVHAIDLEPIGWNTGVFTRLELLDLNLDGAIEVGIYIVFDGGTNNWINIDDVTLFTESKPLPTADEVAAQLVDQLIIDLPDAVDVQLTDGDDIQAARFAYDALTTSQQALVMELDRLMDIETAYAALNDNSDETIAATVDALILALPLPNDITTADQSAIEDARLAYDALTPAQQALVTALETLVAAEDALELAAITEDGYLNLIDDGDFNTLAGWTVDVTGSATNKSAVLNNGHLEIWADGSATFDVKQTLNVQNAVYNLTLYINGGYFGSEFNVDEGYAYVKMGETTYTVDIVPQGWSNGNYIRIETRNIPLNGEVEVGIHINFTSGINNWVNIDDFTLWSLDYPVDVNDQTAADVVIALIDALPTWETITVTYASDVNAARDAYDGLTSTQQLLVSNYLILTGLEDRLLQVSADPMGVFNTEGTFESADWTMSAIGWTTDGGNAWTDGDVAYTGSQSYGFFKNQSGLIASISKPVTLAAGDYDLTFYLQGGDYTSITVTVGTTTQTYVITDTFAEYTLSFTHSGGDIDIQVEVIRPTTAGWVSLDDMVLSYTPS